MVRLNLILGGLKYPTHVLKKYANIYRGDIHIQPFTFTAMMMGDKYNKYTQINNICKQYNHIPA